MLGRVATWNLLNLRCCSRPAPPSPLQSKPAPSPYRNGLPAWTTIWGTFP